MLNNFKFCQPDAFTFSDWIKIKSIHEIDFEYTYFDTDIGYWTISSPFHDNGFELFQNLVGQFPIEKHTNSIEPNQFCCIHLPYWITNNMLFLIKEFFDSHVRKYYNNYSFGEWGNIFIREMIKPLKCYSLPHFDHKIGIVGNLWFSDHSGDRGTYLYKYTGKIHGDYYDFQIDPEHKKFNEYRMLVESKDRYSEWINISDSECEEWGFVQLGLAPAKKNTITLYESSVSHSPFISNKCNYSWSHTFALECTGGII
jgi:hypothetical protein